MLSDLESLWEKASPDERRQLIEPLIDHVYVAIDEQRIGALDPAPAFADLLRNAVEKKYRSEVALVSPDELERRGIPVWWRRGRIELPVQSTSGPDLLRV